MNADMGTTRRSTLAAVIKALCESADSLPVLQDMYKELFSATDDENEAALGFLFRLGAEHANEAAKGRLFGDNLTAPAMVLAAILDGVAHVERVAPDGKCQVQFVHVPMDGRIGKRGEA